jgi:tRNA U34 5-methylaminomethyl-2-thiouridine-forming methyltransferase MnmC
MSELFTTDDGSHTVFSTQFGEHYHSRFGAVTESRHVFIEAGLKPKLQNSSQIDVLEIGFGTGLNALLTALEAEKTDAHLFYTAIEAFPLPEQVWRRLNFDTILSEAAGNIFKKIHLAEWEKQVQITDHFSILKLLEKVENTEFSEGYDLIYYDTFAPNSQPELWTMAVFQKMFKALRPCGILTTYCAKGEVKRNLKTAGFSVENLPGPPRKREMTRAVKPPAPVELTIT